MGEAIKDEIKKDNIPLAYSSCYDRDYVKRLTDIYDVVDIHFMSNEIGRDSARFTEMGKWNLKKYSHACIETSQDQRQS